MEKFAKCDKLTPKQQSSKTNISKQVFSNERIDVAKSFKIAIRNGCRSHFPLGDSDNSIRAFRPLSNSFTCFSLIIKITLKEQIINYLTSHKLIGVNSYR